MKNKVDPYKKEHDVPVFIIGTQETLIINPQISHTSFTDSEGEHKGPDEIAIIISVEDPIPEEEREFFNMPIVVTIENAKKVDELIKALQTLRAQIWGFNLDFNNNIN
jgi:hypothetical protein